MKAALVREGGPKWPDGAKLKRAGISRLYYEAQDPQVDAPFLAELRRLGFEVGSMRDPVWNNYNDSPEQFIARVNADIALLAPKGPDGKRPQLAIMLDIERHDADYVTRALREMKRTQPGRNCVWTMEFHQAGWFSAELVNLINSYGGQLKVMPQCYYGSMDDAVDTHAAARDLYTPHGGVADDKICFFYTCRKPWPLQWDGCLYLESWNQLP